MELCKIIDRGEEDNLYISCNSLCCYFFNTCRDNIPDQKEDGMIMEKENITNECITVSKAIPLHFLKWLASERIRFINEMKTGKKMRYFSAHLPVMATWRDREEFPVNLTVKDIGLIPKEDRIMDYIDLFEATFAQARTMPWMESLPMRLEAIERLYSDIENLDPTSSWRARDL